MPRLLSPALATVLVLAVGGTGAGPVAAATASVPAAAPAATAAAAAAVSTAPAAKSRWRPRPERYPGTTTVTDLAIPMSDGTVLRGDLTLPARADGTAVNRRFPVIVTITAYNKTALGAGGGFGGAAGGSGDYLVQRGYAKLVVDARGTGSSEGTWRAFSHRENRDGAEVIAWAHSRKRLWSNGRIGMAGPSYMGINQIFTAAQRPKGLRAIFPQVPAYDVYRDVVASGGQVDVGFIPLWLGLVTATGIVPPATLGSDTRSGLATLLGHLIGAGTFTAPLLLDAVLGGEAAYDGPFYRERSPGRVIGRVQVPTFLVAGQYDLFQRGTPLLFEDLRERGVPTKMIVGPWDHLQASAGTGLADAGEGTLEELQLRWFDRYVRGRKDARLHRDIRPLTYHEQGTGVWRRTRDWVGPEVTARSYRLSGSAGTGSTHGRLTRGRVRSGTADVLPVPVSGVCTRSASQWTAGLPNAVHADSPCLQDNGPNDRTGIVYETRPLARAVRLAGPINARLFTSSVGGDGMLSVSVSDVAPDGTVSRLTGGWQVLSHRALDRRRSRYVDGKLLQPFHPHTKAAKKRVPPGRVARVDVEVFPTAAKIRPGHRLRIAVQAFDVPHLLPTLPDTPGVLTVMRIHSSERHPSELTIPWVRARR